MKIEILVAYLSFSLCLFAFRLKAVVATLPQCCKPTGPESVQCEFDGFCFGTDYNPVDAAKVISANSSITELFFQINIAPKGEDVKKINDEGLAAVGVNLGDSKTIKKLHLIIGSLEEITGDGLAKLTALNTNAQQILQDLIFDIQINPVTDESADIISGNIANFKNLNSFTFLGQNFQRNTFTSKGVKSIFDGISLLPNLSTLSAHFSRISSISSSDMDKLGEIISTMKTRLTSFEFELSESQLTDPIFKGSIDGINNLKMLTNLQLMLNHNNLSDNTFTSTVSAINNNADLNLVGHFEENFITTEGIKKAVTIINTSNFQGKLSLGLQNQGPNSDIMDEKTFTEPFACLEKHDILDGPISIKETTKVFGTPAHLDYVEVTDYFAEFDEKVCSNGIKLTTHVSGGPQDDYSDVCVSCSAQ